MNRAREEILNQLRLMSKGNNPIMCLTGKVISVDESLLTAIVEINDIQYEINLSAVTEDTDKVFSYIVPVIGSNVIVSFVNGSDTDGFISAFSTIKKIVLNTDEIVFNNGELKGLVKIEPLISKLNNLENAFNDLLTNYKSHNHLHPQGPTTSFVTPSTQNNLEQTKLADLENEKIKM